MGKAFWRGAQSVQWSGSRTPGAHAHHPPQRGKRCAGVQTVSARQEERGLAGKARLRGLSRRGAWNEARERPMRTEGHDWKGQTTGRGGSELREEDRVGGQLVGS